MFELLKTLYHNPLIGGAFVMGIIGALIVSLKSVPAELFKRIKRRIIFSIHIDEVDELYLYFERWLKYNHESQYRNMSAALTEKTNFGESNKSYETNNAHLEDIVYYKQFSDFIIIKYKNHWLTISKERDKIENANSIASLFFNSYTISTFFSKKILMTLIDEVVEYNQQFKPNNGMVPVLSSNTYGDWIKVRNIEPKKIKNIFLDEKIKHDLIKDIDNFIISKDWYNSRSIPYKRGYCFYGEPGNGKTSLALALAQHLNRSISILSLQGMGDEYLRRAFRELGKGTILLIEDIDAIFDKRESKVKDLTFSTLLQCLDGVFCTDNIILIITTNHIEQLDSALLRDGRIDIKLKINNPSLSVIVDYINTFYDSQIDFKLNGDANHIIGISMSNVQNICIKNSNPIDAFNEITKKLVLHE